MLDVAQDQIVLQVPGRQIDGDLHVQARVLPGADLPYRLVDHPAGQRLDEPRLFGEGDERGGRQQAPRRMVPPHEGLDFGHLAARSGDDGLIMEDELILFHGGTQLGHEGEALQPVLVGLGHVDGVTLDHPFRAVHGDVGPLQKQRGVVAVGRRHGDADTGVHMQRQTAQLERAVEGLEHLGGHEFGLFHGVEVGDDDRELIAAEAGDGVGLAQNNLQTLRDLLEDVVAGLVTEGVVDLLEPVEVHQQEADRAGAAARRRQGTVEPVGEQRAVGQSGERIVQGLVGEGVLDSLALADVARDDDDAFDVGVGEEVVGGGLDRHPRAVGVGHAEADGVDDAGPGHTFGQSGGHGLGVVGVHEVQHHRGPEAVRVAQNPCGGRARVLHSALAVEDSDDVGRVLDDQPEARLALAEGILGDLALGDVSLDRHQVGAHTALVGDGVDVVLHPEGGAVLAVVQELDSDRPPLLGGPAQGELGLHRGLGPDQKPRVQADGLIGPVAGLGREGRVDEHDAGLAADVVLGDDDGVAGMDDRRLEEPQALVSWLTPHMSSMSSGATDAMAQKA